MNLFSSEDRKNFKEWRITLVSALNIEQTYGYRRAKTHSPAKVADATLSLFILNKMYIQYMNENIQTFIYPSMYIVNICVHVYFLICHHMGDISHHKKSYE